MVPWEQRKGKPACPSLESSAGAGENKSAREGRRRPRAGEEKCRREVRAVVSSSASGAYTSPPLKLARRRERGGRKEREKWGGRGGWVGVY
jgi:hypothetical protein